MNIARAFAVLHASNIMVGDVNDRGIMVGRDGTVRIIDCDSFQFTAASNDFLCDVGTPGFTPPELQGRHLRSLLRTADHDNFGLAVIIFLLLFMGRHPFAGRYDKGQIEPEAAIKECRYAYSRQPARTLMRPPPNTIAIDRAVDKSVVDLFERAFALPTGIYPQRPTALEWAAALASLRSDLVACQFNIAHEYVKFLNVCPWCELEQRSGIDLFNFLDAGELHGTEIDLEPIWQAITGLTIPSVPVSIGEQGLGRFQASSLPPSLEAKIALLKKRAEEGSRARQASATCAIDATRMRMEAQELNTESTDQNPDVAKLAKAIVRCERSVIRSPLFIGSWFVAMIYFAAAIVFAPIYALLGFIFIVGIVLAVIAHSPIRRRKLAALRGELKVAREVALAADPFRHRKVLDLEKAVRGAEDSAKASDGVANAIDADVSRLSEEIVAEKAECQSRLRGELAVLEAKLAAEKATLDQLRAQSRDLQTEYNRRTHFLRDSLTEWRQLKTRRDGEIKRLRDHDRDAKFEAFLDTHFIAQAAIEGITPTLKAALASFGIETAADIDEQKVLDVQGFGPRRTAKMLSWRRRVASQFIYVPSQTIDPPKIQAIRARFASERRRFERDFQVALTDLQEKFATLSGQVQPAILIANESVRKKAQVRADIQALDKM